MEIRVLKYFLSVAKEGSITAAANVLHLTQPTLSRQLQDLEKELGQKLFIRGSHNISLTQEGLLFRKRAEEIIEMIDKTEAEFTALKDTIAGDIYIGSGETQSIKHISNILSEINKEFPKIKFHLYSGNAHDVSEKLDRGLLDFGILIQPVDLSKYDNLTLPSKDTWGLLMKTTSNLAKKAYVELNDLLDLPVLCSRQVSKDENYRNEFISWFKDKFEKLNIVATYNLIYNASIMVESGLGYAICIDKLINNEKLCFKPFYPKLESGLNIVWKKSQIFTPAAKIFLQKIEEKFK